MKTLSQFFLVMVSVSTSATLAQTIGPGPPELEEVGITEELGAQVPLELTFQEYRHEGKVPVQLSEIFDGTRPVLLTLNYSDCPMLCSLQLDGLFEGLGAMPWALGENFRMLTVSIDPTETPERALLTKEKYLKMYGRAGVAKGWNCLTGKEEDIRRLADTVGFHYTYVEDTREYAHAAAAIILTPDGRVSRYLYGIEYDPQTIRLSLVEASEGKIGSPMDQILLFCFQYDATKGRYAPAAVAVMRVGGLLTIAGLAGLVFVFWRRGSAHVAVPAGESHTMQQTESVE